MSNIDTDWFIKQLERRNMSQSDLARSLKLHRSAITRLLSGKRRMTVEEQDKIAQVFGVGVDEISAHRISTPAGLGERGQAPFSTEIVAAKRNRSEVAQHVDDEELPDHPIWGSMEGTIKVMPGVDLTAPMEFEWGGKLYNE